MSRFSQRLSFPASTNLITQLIAQRQSLGLPLIDLTETNPTRALPNYPHRDIARCLGDLRDVSYSPDPRGGECARQAIVRYYAARNIAVDADQIILAASTSEAYTYLFKLLCDPGDVILSPVPSYPLFEHLAALCSVDIKPYRLLYDGAWHIDFEHLRAQMDARTRAIIVVNPNNPTGHFADAREATRLLEIAAEFDLAVISDEVFLDYPLILRGPQRQSLIGKSVVPRFVMNGLSKTAAMPQMKLAWVVVDGTTEYRTEALRHLELIADTYLSVATPVQQALGGLLRIGEGLCASILEQVKRNWDALQSALSGTSGNACHLEAGWTAIIRLPETRDEEEWVLKLLDEKGVVSQPGYFFDMTHGVHIVVSLLTRPEVFAEGLAGLRDVLTRD